MQSILRMHGAAQRLRGEGMMPHLAANELELPRELVPVEGQTAALTTNQQVGRVHAAPRKMPWETQEFDHSLAELAASTTELRMVLALLLLRPSLPCLRQCSQRRVQTHAAALAINGAQLAASLRVSWFGV